MLLWSPANFFFPTICSFSAKDNMSCRFLFFYFFFPRTLRQTDNNLLKSVFHSYFIVRGNGFRLHSFFFSDHTKRKGGICAFLIGTAWPQLGFFFYVFFFLPTFRYWHKSTSLSLVLSCSFFLLFLSFHRFSEGREKGKTQIFDWMVTVWIWTFVLPTLLPALSLIDLFSSKSNSNWKFCHIWTR